MWLYLLVLTMVTVALYVRRREIGTISKVGVAVLVFAYPGWKITNIIIAKRVSRQDTAAICELVTTEEQILELTPQLSQLSKSLMNLRLPDSTRLDLFASEVSVVDLAMDDNGPSVDVGQRILMSVDGSEAEWGPSSIALWRPLLDQVSWFEHAKFYFVDGHFLGDGRSTFEAEVGFSGLAKMKGGEWGELRGKQKIMWRRERGPQWRIGRWDTKEMSVVTSPRLFFSESLNQALPRPSDYEKARRSEHQRATITFYQGGAKQHPHPYFAPISANQKPGLAIVDIDNDGDDDIYITVRIGKNMLLENQGDGTFVEAASRYGVDFNGHSTCALFADFDNDGDPDLVLGRSLLPSLYVENLGGRFAHASQAIKLPRLVISLSAADFNTDGLLDFYLLTYRPATIGNDSSPSGGVAGQAVNWPDEFFTADMAKEYYRRYKEANSDGDPLFPNLLNQVGPPNVLFVNRGNGRFEPASENDPINIWRNSLQATWSDYDEDGDPDVYIANDWAPDDFFRNDGEAGFTEIADEVGTTGFGFAMGVSWGDYDNDGFQDLYVSNMYSKAGRRITDRIEGLTDLYRQSASGNYLYRQHEDRSFELVSGETPPSLTVAKAGWSWGGQFADFNNDAFLDLYVLSGYFTAPRAVSSDLDL